MRKDKKEKGGAGALVDLFKLLGIPLIIFLVIAGLPAAANLVKGAIGFSHLDSETKAMLYKENPKNSKVISYAGALDPAFELAEKGADPVEAVEAMGKFTRDVSEARVNDMTARQIATETDVGRKDAVVERQGKRIKNAKELVEFFFGEGSALLPSLGCTGVFLLIAAIVLWGIVAFLKGQKRRKSN